MQIKLLEFRNIKETDPNDKTKYGHWSRFWEYPTIHFLLKKYIPQNSNSKIHNTSWGFEPPNHTMFKEELELYYGTNNIINSDIKNSDYPNTTLYDITQHPKSEWINYFDAVLNVSTLEEINHFYQPDAFKNLLLQVKPGGYIIITFDIPGLNLPLFENLLQRQFKTEPDAIVCTQPSVAGLKVGLLVAQKL